MKFVAYIIVYAFLWLISRLPLRCLHIISDGLFPFVYYLVKYRRGVVRSNLEKAFPDYSEEQIKKTEKAFYRHFTDLILESAVMNFIPYERASKRFSLKNPELVEELYKRNMDILGVGGHYGNWEFLNHMENHFDYRFVAIYKPLNNKYFDRMVRNRRSKYGSIMAPVNHVARTLIDLKKKNILSFTGFLADQRPVWQHIQYWTKFMGVDSPVFIGPEKIAKKINSAVVFINIRRLKRGIYEAEFELITQDPKAEKPYAITESYLRHLEKLIMEEPSWYLWSHNRWKFSYEKYKEAHPNYRKLGSSN